MTALLLQSSFIRRTTGRWRPIRHRGRWSIAQHRQPSIVAVVGDWRRCSRRNLHGFAVDGRCGCRRRTIATCHGNGWRQWTTTASETALEPTGSVGRRFGRPVFAGRGRRPTGLDGSDAVASICRLVAAPVCRLWTALNQYYTSPSLLFVRLFPNKYMHTPFWRGLPAFSIGRTVYSLLCLWSCFPPLFSLFFHHHVLIKHRLSFNMPSKSNWWFFRLLIAYIWLRVLTFLFVFEILNYCNNDRINSHSPTRPFLIWILFFISYTSASQCFSFLIAEIQVSILLLPHGVHFHSKRLGIDEKIGTLSFIRYVFLVRKIRM